MNNTYPPQLEAAFEANFKNPKKALELCDKYLENNSPIASCSRIKSNAYKRLGNLSEALKHADDVVRLDPNYKGSYSRRGEIHYELGSYEAAAKDGKQAIELDTDGTLGSIGHRLAAISYAAMGDVRNALHYAQSIPELEIGEWFPPCGPLPAGTKAQFAATVERMASQIRNQRQAT